MGDKIELTEDEMLEEIDRVLMGEARDRFTVEQAEELRKRMGRITDDERKKREFIWDTVIRVKKNEGLTVSDYITELANKHIAGDVTLEEVYELIDAAKEK